MIKKIAFDVDGTLIIKGERGEDIPRYTVLDLMRTMKGFGLDIYVWSGSGIDYAKRWCDKLGLGAMVTVVAKGSFIPDIAIDDELVELGIVNLKV